MSIAGLALLLLGLAAIADICIWFFYYGDRW
jgi:hypothetical protein